MSHKWAMFYLWVDSSGKKHPLSSGYMVPTGTYATLILRMLQDGKMMLYCTFKDYTNVMVTRSIVVEKLPGWKHNGVGCWVKRNLSIAQTPQDLSAPEYAIGVSWSQCKLGNGGTVSPWTQAKIQRWLAKQGLQVEAREPLPGGSMLPVFTLNKGTLLVLTRKAKGGWTLDEVWYPEKTRRK